MSGVPDVRPPAVAGQFYPEDPEELSELVRGFLEGVPAEALKVHGAMVPHAGLIYSGACTAQVLGRLALPPVIVILAPDHSGAAAPGRAALWGSGAFRTPLGDVPIAEPLARRLAMDSELVVEDRPAHQLEHAVEVELPFLQVLAPKSAIVPLLLAWDDWARSRELARDLAGVIAKWPEEVLLVASSDMTHYEPAHLAARKDRLALDQIQILDGDGLLRACRANQITMCGRAPAAVVTEAARVLGSATGRIVDYRHSGLVTGDNERVVAYAGVLME